MQMKIRPTPTKDLLGQLPQLKTYNHGLMVFPLAKETSQDSIIDALKRGIAQIVKSVPWLAEQVVEEVVEKGHSPYYHTQKWPENVEGTRQLYIKDAKALCPSFDEIIRAGGPVGSMDGIHLCPFPGFPLSYDESQIGPAPVVAVQANFIKGGLILSLSNQHNVMDASGVFAFAALLASSMSDGDLPQDLVDQAMIDRSTVVPLLPCDQPIRDHSHYFKKEPIITPHTVPPASSVAEWCLFRVSQHALAEIEKTASDAIDFDPAVSHISSNDALCALYWKRLAGTRLANGRASRQSPSKFARAIDARSAIGQPQGYMGQMIYHASTTLEYGEIVDDMAFSMSALASRLRADLNESNNEWAVRSYATFLDSVPDKSQLIYCGGLNADLDVGSSSMTQRTSGSLEFGPLGKPAMVRRPNLVPVPGLLYFLPPDTDSGHLPLLICLKKEDLDSLKSDAQWRQYVDLVG